MEYFRGYEPGTYLKLIAPTPRLVIAAPLDRLASGQLVTEAYEIASHPKKLVLTEGGHFDAYTGDGFIKSSKAARDWFVEHLVDLK